MLKKLRNNKFTIKQHHLQLALLPFIKTTTTTTPLIVATIDNKFVSHNNNNIATQKRNTCSTTTRWFDPKDEQHITTPIFLFNSLSKSKVPLKIVKRNHYSDSPSPIIHWYSCGPTVYDDTHLGHARNYVSLDIIYRILSHYFNYQILHVMGITDVDDKILKRASELGRQPSELSRKYEIQFIEDMKQLNVIQPSVYTRVTEHIEEIKQFIEEVEKNGFTYTTENGGVYFDSKKFEQSDHYYGKLSPNSLQHESIQQDHIEHKEEKKDPRDFALWKFTSREYLGWESKWGYGRPGWHIECSAMIDHIFKGNNGATIDIHSGGIDLAFPHHNNEIAQSEARNHSHFCSSNETNWCNYFIHVGHLHIKGLKMSKSLKNFITVKEFLKKYTPDQFRIFCLLHQYNQTLDYNEDAIGEAIKVEKRILDFLHNVSFYREECTERSNNMVRKWDREITNYNDKIALIKIDIEKAICDDFDTPTLMSKLCEMINITNALFFTNTTAAGVMKKDFKALELLENISSYIINMLNVLGLQLQTTTAATMMGSDEQVANHPFTTRILDTLMEFRASIRKEALLSNPKQTKILELIDDLRDTKLKELGIKLDDRSGEKSVWRFQSSTLTTQQETSSNVSEHSKRLALRQQELEFKLSISVGDYFKLMPQHMDKNYSQFDDQTGIPTHDADGQPLSKSALKKLHKELEKHSEFLARHK